MKRLVLQLIICLSFIEITAAQEGTYYTIRDLEVWSSAKFKYKMNKKWSIGLEEQLRLKDNASVVDQYFTELELKRDLGNHFSLAAGGRFIRDNDTRGNIQGFENHFRWYTDLAFDHKIERFSLQYRLRYQASNELKVEDISKKTLRFKVESEYNIKHWAFDPKLGVEIFNGLTDLEGFNKVRFNLGTEYKTKKFGEFGAFYRMEIELKGLYPKTTNIAGFSYQYTLKNKKK
ncbi:MAG: DUF2490 domain-containing protein [Bacteroidetes bacterium]|nr:DUF2490 domain-containing protein [Bacteroidota bacterium]